MKALILAGGLPQIDLILKLKEKKIFTILADYSEHPVARDYADMFCRISTLDINAIRDLAVNEKVDFLITVCTDQALLTVAQVSEELGLPCYIDYETAKKVTNKSYMKSVFSENGIPTAKYQIAGHIGSLKIENLKYPLVVKPVDCNSSKGVIKVTTLNELNSAFADALTLSRTKTVIVEEYIEGKELSVDVYVENGIAKILDITTSEKLKEKDKFVISRTWHPAKITRIVRRKVSAIAQKIADAFGLVDSPMLIQMIVRDDDVFVIEFSARTGGGVKHLSIIRRTGFDVISAVIDLTIGNKPHVYTARPHKKYMLDEYIYCKNGEFDCLVGFNELKEAGIMLDYYLFRCKGSRFEKISNSGDRVGGFSIEADTLKELKQKHDVCIAGIKALSTMGEDLIRHDLLNEIDIERL